MGDPVREGSPRFGVAGALTGAVMGKESGLDLTGAGGAGIGATV